MASIELTQAEADALLRMEKRCIDNQQHAFPQMGESLHMLLMSPDMRENFMLDVTRGSIAVSKISYQNRARQIIVLARLDVGGSPHRNPDDSEMPCPHLHLYREGFGDKWAVPVPAEHFSQLQDRWQTFEDFMRFVNITIQPYIERGLFD